MEKTSLSLIAGDCLLLSACATQTGWTPTIDSYNNRNAFRLNQDMHECQQLATHASGGTATETAIGAGVGGLIGAAGGAVLGNAGTGAAIGAAAGGIGGASKQGFQAEQQYKSAYNSCLRQRGHSVIN